MFMNIFSLANNFRNKFKKMKINFKTHTTTGWCKHFTWFWWKLWLTFNTIWSSCLICDKLQWKWSTGPLKLMNLKKFTTFQRKCSTNLRQNCRENIGEPGYWIYMVYKAFSKIWKAMKTYRNECQLVFKYLLHDTERTFILNLRQDGPW